MAINQDEVIVYSTDTPSEVAPPKDLAWKGSPAHPKKITVQSAGVDGFIQRVGVDQNGQVAVPNNTHIAGWFVDSVIPGQTGLSIIDGHVDGRTQGNAIFKDLSKIKAGDIVTITLGNDSIVTYKVFAIKEVALTDAATVLFSQDPTTKNQLNLITCVGTYLEKSRTYDNRLVVSAALQQ